MGKNVEPELSPAPTSHLGIGEPRSPPDSLRLLGPFSWVPRLLTLDHTPRPLILGPPDLPRLTEGTEGPSSSRNAFGAALKSL